MDPHADLAEVVMRAARELRMHEQRSREDLVLKPSNAHIMRHVDAHPGIAPSELAEATGLLRTNVSAALRELERLGLIERRADPDDGRGVRIHPTALAASNFADVRGTWAEAVSAALGDDADVSEAVALLTRLADGVAADRRASGRSTPAGSV